MSKSVYSILVAIVCLVTLACAGCQECDEACVSEHESGAVNPFASQDSYGQWVAQPTASPADKAC
jgi:hypothetical protein